MTKKTKYVGRESNGIKSTQYLSPQKPYTGDGKTTRNIFDTVINVFKTKDQK